MQMLDAHAWSTYINNGMSWDFIWDLVSYNIKEYGDDTIKCLFYEDTWELNNFLNVI